MWAVIFNIWHDEPVYHELAEGALVTKCGRHVGIWTPMIPHKHAEKIGRLCRSCSGC